MDEIDRLLTSFPAGSQDGCCIIEQLEESLDERVVSFFIATLLDETAYDLVRVDILKALRFRQDNSVNRTRFGKAVRNILESDHDALVCQYAAMALDCYVDVEGVLDTLERIVRSLSEDLDVRHNALASIGANVRLPTCHAALARLVDIPELGRSADRILRERGDDSRDE